MCYCKECQYLYFQPAYHRWDNSKPIWKCYIYLPPYINNICGMIGRKQHIYEANSLSDLFKKCPFVEDK